MKTENKNVSQLYLTIWSLKTLSCNRFIPEIENTYNHITTKHIQFDP